LFDVIIENGTIIDGTREPRFCGDVGIADDRITAIGDLKQSQAGLRIEAAGKIVAPGFVDVHNHSDGWLLKTPHHVSKTTQGFTTEVLMADGISYAPVNEHTARQWLLYLRALDGLQLSDYQGWRSLADYMNLIDGRNVQNAATHLPYANVRSMVCGFGRRPVDDYQMRQVKAEIRRGMEEGAVGLSTGLDYIVQCFSSTDELVQACSAMAEYNGLYVTHMRYKQTLMPAMREAVEIGRRAGVRVHFSHLKGVSAPQVEELLEYVDREARHEVDLSFDVYPYLPGSTMLNYLLPYEAWEDGPMAVLGKLADPEIRTRFRYGLEANRLDLEHIQIAWVGSKANTQHQGKILTDYIEEMGVPAEEALANLLIEENLAVLLVFNEGDDKLVHPMLQHDLYMMGTDGIYGEGGAIHPRQYGSVGRLLGPCLRDDKLFSLEEAVYKLSGYPAARFGLQDRGRVKAGQFADLVVFDADTVVDRATFENPHQTCLGIEHVLVNGVPIIQDAAPVDLPAEPLPGRYLKYVPQV
jgi:N-acyl-D-amino-acid deacylase